MLASIIKENHNNYYVNLEEKGNVKVISVICANNKSTRALRKEEALELLKNILSTELTFMEKENGYDVYTDEVDNKRYFKNGQEDYIMFFKNNGISAIEYDYKSMSDKLKKEEQIKTFRFKTGIAVISVTQILLLNTIIANYINPVYPNDPIEVVYDQTSYSDLPMITESEMVDLIKSSNVMLDANKEKLINNDLFHDVLYYADDSRNYELRKKLNNMKIEFFADYEGNTKLGYYDVSDPSTIHLLSILNDYDDTMSHEFIHLLQDNNEYYYIREASAELISSEYFDSSEVDAYRSEVHNLKLLVETIGPKPIMECNFKGDTSSFENEIRQNLSEKDANRLLELFRIPATEFTKDPFKRDEINNEVEDLIVKLYFNKYGEDLTSMDNNSYMRYIYLHNDYSERLYFNEHKNAFYNDIQYGSKSEVIDTVNISDVLNRNDIDYYEYSDIKEIDGRVDKENNTILNYQVEMADGVHWNVNLESYEKDGKLYTVDELKELGLLKEKTIYIENIKVKSVDDIDYNSFKRLNEYCGGNVYTQVYVYFKDGTFSSIYVNYKENIKDEDSNSYMKLNDNIYCSRKANIYRETKFYIPSMADKFKDQLIYNNTSKVESNKDELLTMLDGNGDEIRITYSM